LVTNNLKGQYVTNLKLNGLMCDQNILNDQFITNLKFKGHLVQFSLIFIYHAFRYLILNLIFYQSIIAVSYLKF